MKVILLDGIAIKTTYNDEHVDHEKMPFLKDTCPKNTEKVSILHLDLGANNSTLLGPE